MPTVNSRCPWFSSPKLLAISSEVSVKRCSMAGRTGGYLPDGRCKPQRLQDSWRHQQLPVQGTQRSAWVGMIVDSRATVDALGLQDDTNWVKRRPRTFCATVFNLLSDRLITSWSGSLSFSIIHYPHHDGVR